jgi:hypothetical protein
MMTKDIGDAVKADFDQLFEKWKQMIFELGYKTAKSEIIHCKDCKYWRKTKKQCGYTYLLPQFDADEYCSRAERRDA